MSKYYFPHTQLDETIAHIRLRVRALMNGVTANSMKNAGIIYKKNWGVSLVHLKQLALEIETLPHLPERLWMSNTREWMILATLIPHSSPFTIIQLEDWVTEICNYEIAEIVAMNLFFKVECVDEWIKKTIETEEKETSFALITALLVASRLKEANTTLVKWILQQNYSSNFFVQQSLAKALCAQGRKDANLANIITSWASTNQHLSNYCREELNYI